MLFERQALRSKYCNPPGLPLINDGLYIDAECAKNAPLYPQSALAYAPGARFELPVMFGLKLCI